jgi:hypothetical protein
MSRADAELGHADMASYVPMDAEMQLPSSKDTSSMSDVTDILCAVKRGDLVACAASRVASGVSSVSASPVMPAFKGSGATVSRGASRVAVDDVEVRRLSSDRDLERSECEVGRGVMSAASSKVSCPEKRVSNSDSRGLRDRIPTPSLSELCELVGLVGVFSIVAVLVVRRSEGAGRVDATLKERHSGCSCGLTG